MFEKLGLGAVLQFDSGQAVVGIGKASEAFAKMNKEVMNTKTAMEGAKQLGGAVGAAGLATIPLSLGLGSAISQAAGFQQAMSRLKSVVTDQSALAMNDLRELALEMGETTTFSATQSANAMEALAKAGVDTSAKLKATLPGVLNMAALEGMDLVTASESLVRIMSGMGLPLDQSSRAVNVLAMAANKTTTSVSDLSGGFAYVSGTLKQLGISLEDGAAALGALSDKGLVGTAAGTHFNQMLQHMAKTTPKARKVLDELGMSYKDSKGNFRDFQSIMTELSEKMSKKFPGSADQSAAAITLFGTEGAAAFLKLSESAKDTEDGMFALSKKLRGVDADYAKKMAAMRMDNFIGGMQRFGRIVSNMMVRFFEPILNVVNPMIESLSERLRSVSKAFTALIQGADPGKVASKWGATATAIGQGIADAAAWVKSAILSVRDTVVSVANFFSAESGVVSGDMLRMATKFVAVFLIVAGAVGPVLLAISGIGMVISTVVVPAIEGLAAIIGSALWPAVLIAGALVAVWLLASEQIKAAWAGFVSVITPAWEIISEAALGVWEAIKFAVSEFFAVFGDNVDTAGTNWYEFGIGATEVIASVIATVLDLVKWIIVASTTLMRIGSVVYGIGITIATAMMGVTSYILGVWKLFEDLTAAVVFMISGEWVEGFKRIGIAIVDFVLTPLRMMAKGYVAMMKGMGKEVPQWAETFAAEGVLGLIRPKTETEGAASQALAAKAKEKKQVLKADVKVTNENKVTIDNKLNLDNREIARGQAKHDMEIKDRTGAKETPWQRRLAVEQGAIRVRT